MKIAVCIKQVITREWPLRVSESNVWIRDRDASFDPVRTRATHASTTPAPTSRNHASA